MTSTYDSAVASVDSTIASLDRLISEINQEIADLKIEIRRIAARAWHATTKIASHAWHATVHIASTAYHATAAAVHTTTTFFKNHAAAIASFAASTAVFFGCEAAVGAVTGGVGAIAGAVGCGALAGAVGGAIDQGAKCVDGQHGACSVSAFAGSTILGAVGGAIGGGIGGALGGKLAASVVGDVLPQLVTSTLEGAAIGGIGGGVTGAADYGLTCADSQTGCSWSGLGDATASGAASGAIGGAAGGAVSSLAGSALGRIRSNSGEEDPAASGCASGPHSFTGNTPVLMADGTSKPIDQVKVGDQITDAVPGKKGTQNHTVTAVIVTYTDHDFADVTIQPISQQSTTSTAKAASIPLKTRVLRKAGLGLAASAAGLAALLGLAHHTPGTTNQATPAAYTTTASPTAAPTAEATVAAPNGGTLHTTFHHPFYDQTQSSFVEAQNLHLGDLLQTPTGTAQVTDLHLFHANTTTYDLTIGDLHTYYVMAGSAPILVHNTDGPSCEIFPNLEPENRGVDLAEAKDAGVSPTVPGTPEFDSYIANPTGEIKWGVRPDGSLRIVPTEAADGTEIFHSTLNGDVSGYDYMRAAGTAEIEKTETGYIGRLITNYSGHYQPSEGSTQLGETTFAEYGIVFERVETL
ncbi:polymorphic toxin-type HINT domain-containing protein [Streptacidiphilus sp. EB129]|uniref:polymorphic toxin-type HINT domain-containing protein n=1 Tax=Streptacidiphilus sp. EB129 TaxID=3156262 RepID=UPI00351228B4